MGECAWCGAGEPDIRVLPIRWWPNRRGEVFCSPSHRRESNAALRCFLTDAARSSLAGLRDEIAAAAGMDDCPARAVSKGGA